MSDGSQSLQPPQGREIAIWWLAGSTSDGLEQRLSTLERDRAARFVRLQDRARFIASHAGLRTLLARYLGLVPQEVPITAEPCRQCGLPHGKPILAGDRQLQFSMSHAAGMTVYGISAARLGIDLEHQDALADPAIVLPYLTVGESEMLRRLEPAARRIAALRAWVRKEAFAKATGDGLSDALATVDLGGSEPASPGGWRVVDLSAPDGYLSAVVAAGNEPVQITSRPLVL